MSDDLRLVHQLSSQVWQLGMEIWQVAGPRLEALGLTGPLAELLWLLDPDAEPRTMRDLAVVLHCDASNVTFLADRLHERGLATRAPHPGDRRVKVVTLTPEGREARAQLVSSMLRETPFNRLTADEREALHTLLSKVVTEPRSSVTALKAER